MLGFFRNDTFSFSSADFSVLSSWQSSVGCFRFLIGLCLLQDLFEANKKEMTMVMIKSLTKLLRKYLVDQAKVPGLVDIILHMNLELYSLQRRETVRFGQSFELVTVLSSHDDSACYTLSKFEVVIQSKGNFPFVGDLGNLSEGWNKLICIILLSELCNSITTHKGCLLQARRQYHTESLCQVSGFCCQWKPCRFTRLCTALTEGNSRWAGFKAEICNGTSRGNYTCSKSANLWFLVC